VVDQLVTQLFSNETLEFLDLVIMKFNHATGLHIDQVVMMLVRYFFVARTAIPKVMSLKDPGLFEKTNGSVNRRNADVRIDRRCSTMQFFCIGMILGLGENAGDDTTLPSHAQALFDTELFNSIHLSPATSSLFVFKNLLGRKHLLEKDLPEDKSVRRTGRSAPTRIIGLASAHRPESRKSINSPGGQVRLGNFKEHLRGAALACLPDGSFKKQAT